MFIQNISLQDLKEIKKKDCYKFTRFNFWIFFSYILIKNNRVPLLLSQKIWGYNKFKKEFYNRYIYDERSLTLQGISFIQQEIYIYQALDFLECVKIEKNDIVAEYIIKGRELLKYNNKDVYFSNNPALRHICKNRNALFDNKYKYISRHELQLMKRSKILKIAGFKASKLTLKILSKLEYDIFTDVKLLLMIRDIINNVEHKTLLTLSSFYSINVFIVKLLYLFENKISRQVILDIYKTKFYIRYGSQKPFLDALDYAIKHNIVMENITGVNQLKYELNELLYQIYNQYELKNIPFSSFKDNELELIPITKWGDLKIWGEKADNFALRYCSIKDFKNKDSYIEKNNAYFKMLKPQKGTLKLWFYDETWNIAEIKGLKNIKLTDKTKHLVQSWLHEENCILLNSNAKNQSENFYLTEKEFNKQYANLLLKQPVPKHSIIAKGKIKLKHNIKVSFFTEKYTQNGSFYDINDLALDFLNNEIVYYSILDNKQDYIFSLVYNKNYDNLWAFNEFYHKKDINVPYDIKAMIHIWLSNYEYFIKNS